MTPNGGDLSYETDSGPKTKTEFSSDSGDDDGGDDVPTTLPAGQTPIDHHAQKTNIPFGVIPHFDKIAITRLAVFTKWTVRSIYGWLCRKCMDRTTLLSK